MPNKYYIIIFSAIAAMFGFQIAYLLIGIDSSRQNEEVIITYPDPILIPIEEPPRVDNIKSVPVDSVAINLPKIIPSVTNRTKKRKSTVTKNQKKIVANRIINKEHASPRKRINSYSMTANQSSYTYSGVNRTVVVKKLAWMK